MAAFFDTNSLLYSGSSETSKADRIEALLREGGWISVQVLNEAVRVMRGKWNLNWEEVQEALAGLEMLLTIVPVDISTHRQAVRIAARYKLGIFDACIVAAALQWECDTLYSEDMHHGLVIDGQLSIVNPFRA